jgi:two-component system sensor histidine kinase UhpB
MGQDSGRTVLEAIDAEQQRLAQSLHDTVCQSLTGMNILAGLIARKLKAIAPEISDEVAELRDLIGQTSEEVHDMVRWLRPPALADGGLLFALQELAEEISKRLPCSFSASGGPISIDAYVSAQLFHIVQTVLQDSIGGSGTTKIAITAEVSERQIALAVEHDAATGTSSDERPAKTHVAWQITERRAAAIGATISAIPGGRGHLVECHLPHPGAEIE